MKLSHTVHTAKDGYVSYRISIHTREAQGVVVVGTDGWDYSQFDCREPNNKYHKSSRKLNIRISMNSPLRLTMKQYRKINRYIENLWWEANRGQE